MSTEKVKTKQREWSAEAIQSVVDAIGRGMSVNRACKAVGIPRSTFRDKASQKTAVGCRNGKRPVLSAEEELTLARHVAEMADEGRPIRMEDLCDTVLDIVTLGNRATPFTGGRPGRSWRESFLKRHPQVRGKLRRAKPEPGGRRMQTSPPASDHDYGSPQRPAAALRSPKREASPQPTVSPLKLTIAASPQPPVAARSSKRSLSLLSTIAKRSSKQTASSLSTVAAHSSKQTVAAHSSKQTASPLSTIAAHSSKQTVAAHSSKQTVAAHSSKQTVAAHSSKQTVSPPSASLPEPAGTPDSSNSSSSSDSDSESASGPEKLAQVRVDILKEEAKRKRSREEEEHRTRKRAERAEAAIRLEILKTELLIKKEVLKQEINKTRKMV